jgi:hypothetical protein
MKLLLLLSVYFTAFNKAESALTKEEILDDAAWLYAQFSLTFNPDEITDWGAPPEGSSTALTSTQELDASESLIPLYRYYKNHKNVFDNYKSVIKFFDTTKLLQLIPQFSSADELESRFAERIHFYQNEIMKQDFIPLPFNAFFKMFQKFKIVIGKERLAIIPQDNYEFCHSRLLNRKTIIESLKLFKLRSYRSGNKNDLNYLKVSSKFVEHLKGSKEPKPEKWSIHHMIPSATIVDFYQYYFEMLSQQSDELLQTKRTRGDTNIEIDSIKILEIQAQKMFLAYADEIWENYGKDEERPVDNYDKNSKSAQEDFVRFWHRFPLGLLFYGPEGPIRKDDPSYPKNRRDEYTNFPNDFEERVINIVGKEYFEKVAKLNTEILDFNTAYESKTKIVDELKKMAMKINMRLRTIHREAPWANKIIAPFDTYEWDKGDPISDHPRAHIWEIVKMYDWAEKALAQQSDWAEQFDLARQLSLLSVGLLTNEVRHAVSSHGGEFKRKKRYHHSTDERLSYVQKLDMKCDAERKALTTTTEKPKGFWCSPFYLRLNPMMYFWCRIAGHQNLHFF